MHEEKNHKRSLDDRNQQRDHDEDRGIEQLLVPVAPAAGEGASERPAADRSAISPSKAALPASLTLAASPSMPALG